MTTRRELGFLEMLAGAVLIGIALEMAVGPGDASASQDYQQWLLEQDLRRQESAHRHWQEMNRIHIDAMTGF